MYNSGGQASNKEFLMAERTDAPLSGLFRVVYFLAVAVVAVFLVVTAVVSFYEAPSGDSVNPNDFVPGTFTVPLAAANDRDDYNRNVALILIAVSAGAFAASILAFGSRFNPLRAGLLLGGLVIYLFGIGFWTGASNQWSGFLMSLIAFAVLAGSFAFLEEGFPPQYLERRPVVRLDIPPAAPAAPVPPLEPPPLAEPPLPTDEQPPHPPI
jgi:hypothetical protein